MLIDGNQSWTRFVSTTRMNRTWSGNAAAAGTENGALVSPVSGQRADSEGGRALNPTHILQFDGVLGDITAVSWQANGVHIRFVYIPSLGLCATEESSF